MTTVVEGQAQRRAPDVRPLSPERLHDVLAFFDGDAFSDNPDWASCYCQCYLEDHAVVRWDDRSAADNRALAERRIGDGAMQGLLAYLDGRVVGFCNAGPRAQFHVLDAEPLEGGDRVGAILCFVVAPDARGKGVATALLDAACRRLEAQGYAFVEANPRDRAEGPAANHHGPLGMFLAAGFAVRATDDDGSLWVRKALGAAPAASAVDGAG